MKYKIKISNRVADHIINAILIFASVFLAFWMNEIRIENKETELTYDAKKAILTEWKINLIIIERSNSYHEVILKKGEESILKNIDTINFFALELIPGLSNGIQNETITSNSLSLVDDQQINFDIKTRLTINQIHEQQKKLVAAINTITNDFLIQRELFNKTKAKENYLMFYSLLEDLIEQENNTIARLKEAINEFEE
jgi:hypothetical protein